MLINVYLFSFRADDSDKKVKKVKLLSAPGFSDDDEAVDVQQKPPADGDTSKEEKKQKKNKFKASARDSGGGVATVANSKADSKPAAGSGPTAAAAAVTAIAEAIKQYKARSYALLKPGSWDEQVSRPMVRTERSASSCRVPPIHRPVSDL